MIDPTTPGEEGWKAFAAQLRGYVSRRVDPGSTDDVVGDVLLRLVRHREQLQEAKNPSAWVQRVATNAVADHHRRQSTERRTLAGLEAELDDEATSDGEHDGTASAEIAGCLVPFIRSLSEPYRSALLLTDIGGMTQTAAAERLGLSPSGMKSRVQRGRAKLKQVIQRCCALELDRRGGIVSYRSRGTGCGAACDTARSPRS
jgi:RNA polymerase sigma-70 factor (ECF subfamily)